MREKVELRELVGPMLHTYGIFSTGIIVDYSNPNKIQTVPYKKIDNRLYVDLKVLNSTYQKFDVLELLYTTFVKDKKINSSKEEVCLKDNNLNNIRIENLEIRKKQGIVTKFEDKLRNIFTKNSNKRPLLKMIDIAMRYSNMEAMYSIKRSINASRDLASFLWANRDFFASYRNYIRKEDFNYIKNLDEQFYIMELCITDGVDVASDYYNIPNTFLNLVMTGKEWGHINWLLKNLHKYRNIF